MNSNEAFDSMWTALVDVEEYLQYGIANQLNTAVSFSGEDMIPVLKAFQTVRRLKPYLSTDAFSATNASLEIAQVGLNKFLDALRTYVSIPKTEINSREVAKRKSYNVLNTLLQEFRSSIQEVSALRNSTISSSRKRSEISYDAFISHASEDKKKFVRPLVEELEKYNCRVWYDEFKLEVGDSIRQSIDKGLVNSRFGIIVLSHSFFAKNWTEYELNGLVAQEIEGRKMILPIWYDITKKDILQYSPSLADKFALSTSRYTVDEIAAQLNSLFKKQ